jgi:glycosyltransferase involved in cell wall biosynthesis
MRNEEENNPAAVSLIRHSAFSIQQSPDPLRVVHLSTSDSSGGAARAAFRLHTGLGRIGVESSMLVEERKTDDPRVKRVRTPGDLVSRLRRKVRRAAIARDGARYPNRPPSLDWFSDDRTPHADQIVGQLPPCDVVNLHWVAGFVDYEGFFPAAAKLGVPLVWRLADMNAFTGGCHYDDGSGKFTGECGACHQLGSTNPNDLSRQIWQRKKRALAAVPDGGLHLVGTSRWIAGEAKRSSLLGRFESTIIPNGLDVKDFAPRDRKFSRDFFDLPPDAKIVLFAADSAATVRKGFAYLAEALQGVRDVPGLLLVSVGGGDPKIEGVPHRHLGRIRDDRVLSLAYSAADVYVIASLQESFGQTVTESMACGTPVVGFASGGIVDMVRPGVTGELAPTRDVAAMREAVKKVLSDPARRAEMGANCRRVVMEEYSLDVQARSYETLYRALVERRRAR